MSTLIVIAKEPVAGRVKTRLCPPFTPVQAATLAKAALLDTLDVVLSTPVRHRLLVLDGEAGEWLPREARDRFTIVPQASGTLDVRLAAAFAQAARLDQGPALLVGMDTPQLSAQTLTKGLIALGAEVGSADGGYGGNDGGGAGDVSAAPQTDAEADAVFGPAEDGGFWALGLREPADARVPGLLIGVPMSRSDTGRRQHERLAAADLRISILPTLRDVDHEPDARMAAAQAPDTRFARALRDLTPGGAQADGNAGVHADLRGGDAAAAVTAGADGWNGWNGPVSSGYERALWLILARSGARADERTAEPILLRCESGTVFHLDVAKYAAAPDETDSAVLDRCTGPTLDIGCGPGRLAAELARRGVPSLGVDVTPVALLIARAAGATALRRSVFDRLPGEGRWPYALLIDGNIGIGGDPAALLARIKGLLRPRGGKLLVENAAAELDERHELRLGEHGAAVPWASVGRGALLALARPLGYRWEAGWESAGRSFTVLAT